MADQRCCLQEQRVALTDEGRTFQAALTGHGSHHKHVIAFRDVVKTLHTVEVNYLCRSRQAKVHEWHKTLATRQEFSRLAMGHEQGDGFL
jgi:hypothetical protein